MHQPDTALPAVRPSFNDTQLAWLEAALRPPCCHVTGEHNPRHWMQAGTVCQMQKADAYDRIREALGLGKVTASDGRAEPQCRWCTRAEHRRKAQADTVASQLDADTGTEARLHILATGCTYTHEATQWLDGVEETLREGRRWQIERDRTASSASAVMGLTWRWPALEANAKHNARPVVVLIDMHHWDLMLHKHSAHALDALRECMKGSRGVHVVAMHGHRQGAAGETAHRKAQARLADAMRRLDASSA